ncbi:hypothetical protein F4604DRAFT_1674557 [Suillus subluteus]|nr:hypothetical protein F4604DRAFT_1674557 [Suillus subluteus]
MGGSLIILIGTEAHVDGGTIPSTGGDRTLKISFNVSMFHVSIPQSMQIPPNLRAHAQPLLTTLPSQTLIHTFIPPSSHFLFTAQHATRSWNIWRARCDFANPSASHFGMVGETWFLVMDVFNLPNYEVLRGSKMTLPILDNDFSQWVNAIIQKTRQMCRGIYYPHLYVTSPL